jgi:hypothetical protein
VKKSGKWRRGTVMQAKIKAGFDVHIVPNVINDIVYSGSAFRTRKYYTALRAAVCLR